MPAPTPLSGSSLEMLARRYMEVQAIIRRWSRRYDERLLEQLIYMPEVKPGDCDRADFMRGWMAELEARLNARGDGRAQLPARTARRRLTAIRRASWCARPSTALTTEKMLHREFFESAEYQRIAELARTLAGLIGEGAYVTRGKRARGGRLASSRR